jgi:hypothetical protein
MRQLTVPKGRNGSGSTRSVQLCHVGFTPKCDGNSDFPAGRDVPIATVCIAKDSELYIAVGYREVGHRTKM